MREVILKSTELGELSEAVLMRGGNICLKARGSSMDPFIRDGDILYIHPAKESSLVVGDVALYRTEGARLIAHRVVGKKKQNGRNILKIQGDALSGPCCSVFTEQVLGKVTSIQRGDKLIRFDRFDQRLMVTSWIRLVPIVLKPVRPVRKVKNLIAWWMRRLQALKPYRILVKKLIGRKVHYRVVTFEDSPDLSKLYGYKRSIEVVDPVEGSDGHSDSLNGSEYTIIAFVREKIAGATVIRRFSKNHSFYTAWWLFGMTVRTRYRGAGIGEGMVDLAIEKASEDGAEKLNLLVFEKNIPALNLYKKMGFMKTPRRGLCNQIEKKPRTEENHRVIMSKLLHPLPTEQQNNVL